MRLMDWAGNVVVCPRLWVAVVAVLLEVAIIVLLVVQLIGMLVVWWVALVGVMMEAALLYLLCLMQAALSITAPVSLDKYSEMYDETTYKGSILEKLFGSYFIQSISKSPSLAFKSLGFRNPYVC